MLWQCVTADRRMGAFDIEPDDRVIALHTDVCNALS